MKKVVTHRLDRIKNIEVKWIKYIFSNEKEMLYYFIDVLKVGSPDVITGWNTDFFDLPYLINRMKRVGVRYENLSPLGIVYLPFPKKNFRTGDMEQNIPVIKGINQFDLLKPYKKLNITELRSNSLGNVGLNVLGVEKVEYVGCLGNLYNTNIDKFCEYNVGDVELCKHIDMKVGIIEYFFQLSKFIGCKIGDTMSNSRMGDIFTLKYCKKKGICLPTKNPTTPETFEGATVINPKVGIHKNIIVLDLKRIYPSIIISCNMSPETVDKENGEIDLGNGMRFRKDIVGFSPEVLKELFKLRDIRSKIKKKFNIDSLEWEKAKREEQFVKDLINSFYGLLSYSGYRLYSPEIGSSVTYMGRKIIEFTIKNIEELGYKVIYGDTDSIFVQGKLDNIITEGKNIQEFLNSKFDEFASLYNINNHCFRIEFEKVYEKIMFLLRKTTKEGAKKRYFGKLIYQNEQKINKIDFKGLENKRSDSSKVTSNLMMDVMKMIINDVGKIDIDYYIKNEIRKFVFLDIENIGVPKGIQKNIKDYSGLNKNNQKKGVPPQIRGVIYMKDNFGVIIGKGDKPMFVYLKRKIANIYKYPNTNVISFVDKNEIPNDFWFEFEIDYKKMIEKLITSKMRNIYESIGWFYLDEGIQLSLFGDFGNESFNTFFPKRFWFISSFFGK